MKLIFDLFRIFTKNDHLSLSRALTLLDSVGKCSSIFCNLVINITSLLYLYELQPYCLNHKALFFVICIVNHYDI